MKRVDALFTVDRARSDLFSAYAPGNVPYVGNGMGDNAVVGLVAPLEGDRIFTKPGIAVSAFCEATVQLPPFIVCGRAGNGLVVLTPKNSMSVAELAYFAAYINSFVRWRFSWYWQTTADRLARLELPDKAPGGIQFNVRAYVPPKSAPAAEQAKLKFARFALGDIYNLRPGDYHSLTELRPGKIPVVSCGDLENGVCGYYDVPDHVYQHRMTIAFNGATLAAKYHPYRFAAKDDVAICEPKVPLRLTTEMLIQVMLRREKWRFSYYRKCYKEKLERVTVELPVRATQIDEDAIEDVMKITPYWHYLQGKLHAGATQ